MYRSTAIFIKILQRRSQFRRVNIFRCYTFINIQSGGWHKRATATTTATAATAAHGKMARDDQSWRELALYTHTAKCLHSIGFVYGYDTN